MLPRMRKRSSSYDVKKVMTPLPLPEFRETIIDDNKKVFDQAEATGSQRPLAVVLGWLMGKPHYVQKYTEIYLSEGFDVIQVRVFLKDMLVTRNAKKVADKILQIACENKRTTQPVFVHGLSVGCYIYMEMLIHTCNTNNRFSNFASRVFGQIYDSPVDAPTATKAVARGTSNNPLLQNLMKITTEAFLFVNRKSKRDYHEASRVVKANDNRIPTLLLFSLGDPVFVPEIFVKMIEDQRNRGIDAVSVKWENPRHVQIYRECPDEYRLAVKTFMNERNPLENQLREDTQLTQGVYSTRL